MKKDIKAILFDIGGVLQLGKYSPIAMRRHRALSVHNYMARKFKIGLDQWFDSIDTAYAKSIEGKITKSKALAIMAKNLNTSPKELEKSFVYAYRKFFKRNTRLYSIAYNLKKQGYKIGILSDQWHISEEALIPKEDSKKFNISIISPKVKLRKPDPKIFKLTLKKLKLKPEQIIFIDNQEWNINAAKKLKFKTILFKNNKSTIKELKNYGVLK